MRKTGAIAAVIGLLSLLAVIMPSPLSDTGGLQTEAASAQGNQIVVRSDVPEAIVDGRPDNVATLREAANFAWNEFIALNWPAVPQTGNVAVRERDQPDVNKQFGDPASNGMGALDNPLVWHTYRHKVETYPGQGDAPGFDVENPNKVDFGYNFIATDEPTGPVYRYGEDFTEGGLVPFCGDPANAPTQTSWINLDEVDQISLDTMFAGVLEGHSAPPGIDNSDIQIFRYLAKSNIVEFDYVARGGLNSNGVNEPYWRRDAGSAYGIANENAKLAVADRMTPQNPTISFDPGTIEVKSAWRALTADELASGRFYTAPVRYYEQNADGETCYWQDVWGMAALHIMHKTATSPYFIYATFEQGDNILYPGGQPAEDVVGQPLDIDGQPTENPSADSNSCDNPTEPTCPQITYEDRPGSEGGPESTAVGPECTDTGDQLFYRNEPIAAGVPPDIRVCINFRDHLIPETIRQANEDAHAAIMANSDNPEPWIYYKLVNVQWRPFNRAEIETDLESIFSPSVYYLANIVVETDLALQNFFGRLTGASDKSGYLPTTFETDGVTGFQNVYVFNEQGVNSWDMGGCMGCHGNAQVKGDDFSFIMKGGPVSEPELPKLQPSE